MNLSTPVWDTISKSSGREIGTRDGEYEGNGGDGDEGNGGDEESRGAAAGGEVENEEGKRENEEGKRENEEGKRENEEGKRENEEGKRENEEEEEEVKHEEEVEYEEEKKENDEEEESTMDLKNEEKICEIKHDHPPTKLPLNQVSSERSIGPYRGESSSRSLLRYSQVPSLSRIPKAQQAKIDEKCETGATSLSPLESLEIPNSEVEKLGRRSSDSSTPSRGGKRRNFSMSLKQMEEDAIAKQASKSPRRSSYIGLGQMEDAALVKSLSGDLKAELNNSMSSLPSPAKLARKSSDRSWGSIPSTHSLATSAKLAIMSPDPMTRRLSNQSTDNSARRSYCSPTSQPEGDAPSNNFISRSPHQNTTVIVPSSLDDSGDLDITCSSRGTIDEENYDIDSLLDRAPSSSRRLTAPADFLNPPNLAVYDELSESESTRNSSAVRESLRQGNIPHVGVTLGPAPIPPPPNFTPSRIRDSSDPDSGDEDPINLPIEEDEPAPFDAIVEDTFLADTIQSATHLANTPVAAENVAVIRDKDEKMISPTKGPRLIYVASGFVLLAIIATIALFFFRREPTNIAISASPTPIPASMELFEPTLSPTTTSLFAAVQVVLDEQVSSFELLQTPGTPQNMAIRWIISTDELQRPLDDPRFLQRYVLAVWYFSTNGERWGCARSAQSCPEVSFLVPIDECSWFGVVCQDGQISGLDIGLEKGYNIKGTIPEELCHLAQLSAFRMPNNQLSGTIPSCFGTSLRSMLRLNIVNNNVESPLPTSILRLPSLTHLHLSRNKFQEDFPDISKLRNLQEFQADNNGFTGSIKPGIGNLQSLGVFRVENNKMNGTIPTEFGTLSSLEIFTFSNNRLYGTLPSQSFNKTFLRWFWASNNSFTGTISPYVGNLGLKVQRGKLIWLEGNEFSGTIPSQLGDIVNLRELKLDRNNFVGEVPDTLCLARGDRFNDLSILNVDCASVNCSCCSNC